MAVDTRPHVARAAKKRKRIRKAGDLQAVKRRLWEAIENAVAIMRTAEDDALVLRCVHAITQATASYTKIIESAEIEARVTELERTMLHKNGR